LLRAALYVCIPYAEDVYTSCGFLTPPPPQECRQVVGVGGVGGG
jgi:hypothetical protein